MAMGAPLPKGEGWSARQRTGATIVVLLAALAFLSYYMGRGQPDVVESELGCFSGATSIVCELPSGATLRVPQDIGWTDSAGADHFDGRPGCLPPTGRLLDNPVRLSWLPLEVYGRPLRQVVWVTCLP